MAGIATTVHAASTRLRVASLNRLESTSISLPMNSSATLPEGKGSLGTGLSRNLHIGSLQPNQP
jgi:hypothetical protein